MNPKRQLPKYKQINSEIQFQLYIIRACHMENENIDLKPIALYINPIF
jgi:hypothetical protein